MGALADGLTIRRVAPSPPTVGVVFPGDPAAPGTWSGIPRGVIDGLRALGADPRPLLAARSPRGHALIHNAVALCALPLAHQPGLTARLALARAVACNTPTLGRV